MTGPHTTPPHNSASSPPASRVGQPMIRATFRPTASWLRIGPAWAVLAGALSLPLGAWDAADLLRVLAAVVLADPIWGAIWHTAQQGMVESRVPPSPVAVREPIPFALPGSPAARLAAWLRGEPAAADQTGTWHAAAGWPVALLLALLLALPLGPAALILTGGVLGLSLLRLVWSRHDRAPPAMLDASLVVGLPWMLGITATNDLQLVATLQVGAFVLLTWGILRAEQGLRFARGLIVVGQLAVLMVLVWQRLPLAAGLLGACFVMPWWLLAWTPGTPAGTYALRAMQPWLLAAMLLSVIIRS